MERADASPACPFCGGPLPPPAVEGALVMGTSYGVRVCGACAVGVTTPFPSPADLEAAYALGRYRAEGGERFGLPLLEWAVRLFREARRRRVERFAPRGRILDVGCGRGLFLAVMKRRGWDAVGVEADESSARAAAARFGVDVRWGDPAAWGLPDGAFDAVTMNHSLEHMRDPAAAVAAVRRLLRPGGLLLVAVPDLDSVQARFGGASWLHLDPPFHLYHFSGEGLVRYLRGAGFEIAGVRRFDLEYNVFGWLQTLLNRSGIARNCLFDRLRGAGAAAGATPAPSRADLALSALLLVPYLPLALALSLYESFVVKKGGTVEIRAVKGR